MKVPQPDLYAILGVTRNATRTEIGRAYRALLRRHHPDTRISDEQSDGNRSDAAFQQVVAAYAVLGDPERRADYDRQAPERPRPAAWRVQGYTQQAGQPPIVAGPVRWHRR